MKHFTLAVLLAFVIANLPLTAKNSLSSFSAKGTDNSSTYKNSSPVALDDSYVGAIEGGAFNSPHSVLKNDSDPNGMSLTAILQEGPLHGDLQLKSDGNFSYTHFGDEVSVDYFTYWASNGKGYSKLARVTLAITMVNDAPIANNIFFSLPIQQAVLAVDVPGVLKNDFDMEGDKLSASAIKEQNNSQGTLKLVEDGSFTYEKFFGSTDYYKDEFIYKVTDGANNSNDAIITIHANVDNNKPVAKDDYYEKLSSEGDELVITSPGVLKNDEYTNSNSWFEKKISATLLDRPANGWIDLSSDGSFRYQHNGSENLEDQFSYIISDGIDIGNKATVYIVVDAVNDPPQGGLDYYSEIPEGGTITVPSPGVLANDTDPENASLTAEVNKSPKFGTLSLSANGGFTYRHDGSENFSDSFTYKVSDGVNVSNEILVTLSIDPVNDPPVANDDSYVETFLEGGTLSTLAPGVLLNDTDDGPSTALEAHLVQNVSYGVLTLKSEGSFQYKHDGSENHTDQFTYRAYDGKNYSDIAKVTLVARPVNDPPVGMPDSYSVNEGATLSISSSAGVLANDTDAEGDKLTAKLRGMPQHGTINLKLDGSFDYVHDGSEEPTDAFSYKAFDATDSSALVTVTITVNPINDPPEYISTPVTAASDDILYTYNIELSDAENDNLALLAMIKPAWLTLDKVDNTHYKLHGTPLLSDVGEAYVELHLKDGPLAIPVVQSFTIKVIHENEPPVFSSSPTTNADEDALYSYDIEAQDNDHSILTFDANFNTNWLEFDPSTGNKSARLYGTPLQVHVDKLYPVIIYVSDGIETVEQSFSIKVNNVNDQPVFTSQPITTSNEDVLYEYFITTSDEDSDVMTISAIEMPDFLTLNLISNGSARLYGTPDRSDVGDHNIKLSVTDQIGSPVLQEFNLRVIQVNDKPIASPDNYQVNEHALLSVSALNGVLQNDFDPENKELSAFLISVPSYSSVFSFNPNGSFTYQHNGKHIASDQFTYKVTNGVDTSIATTVTIEVFLMNDRPVARNDEYTTTEGGTLTVSEANGIFANDTDEESPNALTLKSILRYTQYGSLVVTASTGAFVYTHDGSETTMDYFDYIVQDPEGAVDTARVTIVIYPVNDPPVLSSISSNIIEFSEGSSPIRIMPLVQVSDVDDEQLASAHVQIGNNYQAGEDSLLLNGTFTGISALYDKATGTLNLSGATPLSIYQSALQNIRYVNTNQLNPSTAERTLSIRVNDGKAISNTVLKTIHILPINDPPFITSLSISSTHRIFEKVVSDYQYSDPEGDPEGKGIYQWFQSATTDGIGKTLIEDADTTFFVPSFDNGGKYLQFELTPADNKGAYGIRKVSNYLYINAAPEARNLILEGSRSPGEILSALFDYVDYENDLEGTHTYQWYRSDTGSAFLPQIIPGATSSSYTILEADEDKFLAVEVTPVASMGSKTGRPTLSGWTMVSLLPTVDVSGTITICDDSTGFLKLQHYGEYPIYLTYSINGVEQNEPVEIQDKDTRTLQVSDTGEYEIVKVWNDHFNEGISTGTAHVSYFQNPSILISGKIAICENDTHTHYFPLHIEGGLAPYRVYYKINDEFGGELHDVRKKDSLAVKLSRLGNYTIDQVIDSRGCNSKGIGTAGVIEKLTPKVVISGTEIFCEGDSALIKVSLVSGSGPWQFSYLWNNEEKEIKIDDPEETEFHLYEKRDGDYTLMSAATQTDGEGCVSGIATISKHKQPVGSISGNYQICSDIDTALTVNLTGTAPWSFTYALNGITQDTLKDISTSQMKLRASRDGKYTLHRLSDAYCPGRTSDTAYIDTLSLPKVRILNLQDVYSINDESLLLNASPSGGVFNGDGAYLYEHNAGDWIFDPKQTTASVDSPYNISYTYVKPETGCASTDSVRVYVVSGVGNILILNSNDTICVSSDTIILRGVHSGSGSASGRFRVEGDKGLITLNNDTALLVPSLIIDESGFHKRKVYYSFDLTGGEGTVSRDIYFQRPDADFYWSNSCFSDSSRVKFIGQSMGYDSTTNHTWRFHLSDGIQQELNSSPEIYHTFRENSNYKVEHIVKTDFGCIDTVAKTIKLQESITLASGTYTESFDDGANGWTTGSSLPENQVWSLGIPQGSAIQQPAAGSSVWYTKINDRSKATQSYLESPCFSFGNNDRLLIKFNMWRAFEMNESVADDGAVLQYTTNGETWSNIGTLSDGIEWYNADNIPAFPGQQSFGWNRISDTEWKEARHSFDRIGNQRFVRFRFAYSSTGNEISNDGIGIDNFSVTQRNKVVLLEHFTNVSDTLSMRANSKLNSIANEFGYDIVDIQYHTAQPGGDPFFAVNPIAINSRINYYGVSKIPYTLVDGGRNTQPIMAIDYVSQNISREEMIKSFLVENKMDIDLQVVEAQGDLNVKVGLTAKTAIPRRLLNLYVVVTERTVSDFTSIHGENEFEGVFVTMLPSPEGTNFYMNWPEGHNEQISFDWNIQRVRNKDELRIVVFLQDPETKEVYQTNYADLVPLVNSDDVQLENNRERFFKLTPNPVIDMAYVRFNEKLKVDGVLKISSITGQQIQVLNVNTSETKEIDFTNYRPGVYFIHLITNDRQVQVQKFIVTH